MPGRRYATVPCNNETDRGRDNCGTALRNKTKSHEPGTQHKLNNEQAVFFLSFSSFSRLAGQRRQSVCANSAVVSALVSITRSQGWSDRMMPSYEETNLWDHRRDVSYVWQLGSPLHSQIENLDITI